MEHIFYPTDVDKYICIYFFLRKLVSILVLYQNNLKMASNNQDVIVRQNQSSNVRQLLKDKGMIGYVSTYELAIYVQLWSDFCEQGLTPEIKKRFQTFDGIMEKRINDAKMEVDGLLID